MDFTLDAEHVFPVGTTVTVYKATSRRLGAKPIGGAITSAIMQVGGVTFTGLAAKTDYVAYAEVNGEHRYVGFGTYLPPARTATMEDVATLDAEKVDKDTPNTITANHTFATAEAGQPATVNDLLRERIPVHNVRWYGADPTGQRDSSDAIDAAVNAAKADGPGSVVYFPPGHYRVTRPIDLPARITLKGSHGPIWWQDPDNTVKGSDAANAVLGGCAIFADEGFTEDATYNGIIRILDAEITGEDGQPWGVHISRIHVCGMGVGSDLHCILLVGQVSDPVFDGVEVTNSSGSGVRFASYQHNDGSWHNPINGRFLHCIARNNDEMGWWIETATDCTWISCWSHRNGQRGWYQAGGAHNEFIACKAEWNGTDGFRAQTAGTLTFIGCRTDRNETHGISVGAGCHHVRIVDCGCYRDGRNTALPNLAGIHLAGSAEAPVEHVEIVASQVVVGDDGDGSNQGPFKGISYKYVENLYIDGEIEAVNESFYDAGNNGRVRFGWGARSNQVWEAVTRSLWAANDTHEVLAFRRFWDTEDRLAILGKGIIRMMEVDGDPPAPDADNVLIFARDNGTGKTELCARFPTGDVQVLATEP